jgi:hypothetical protein
MLIGFPDVQLKSTLDSRKAATLAKYIKNRNVQSTPSATDSKLPVTVKTSPVAVWNMTGIKTM